MTDSKGEEILKDIVSEQVRELARLITVLYEARDALMVIHEEMVDERDEIEVDDWIVIAAKAISLINHATAAPLVDEAPTPPAQGEG